jgi:hypothetical protein
MARTGDHHVKRSKPGSERQKLHISPHIWKLDQKDKCIHKYNVILYIITYNIVIL